MTILVGTACWADKSLVDSGRFYPPDVTSPEARLRYYTSQFPIVEVDSSYYAMPVPATTQQWAERTPHDFVFNIEAFRLFTGHGAQPRVLPKDIQDALGPLLPGAAAAACSRQARHRAFPVRPWVTSGGEPRRLVEHCARVMAGTVMAVEFRNVSWWNERNRESTLPSSASMGSSTWWSTDLKAWATACRLSGSDVAEVGRRPHARPQPRDVESQGAQGRV